MKTFIRKTLNKLGYDIVKHDVECRSACGIYFTPYGRFSLPKESLLTDSVAYAISHGKFFEEDVFFKAFDFINEESIVLDIGANYGQMAVRFAGNCKQVYAFEPQVYSYLCKNIYFNDWCDNVVAIYNPVYAINGVGFKFNSTTNYSSNHMVRDKSGLSSITIDSLNIEGKIDFIKVDVQGCDLFAMQGAVETIKKNKPAIIFEYEQSLQYKFGTTFQDYVDFVNDIGYKFVETIYGINYLILSK